MASGEDIPLLFESKYLMPFAVKDEKAFQRAMVGFDGEDEAGATTGDGEAGMEGQGAAASGVVDAMAIDAGAVTSRWLSFMSDFCTQIYIFNVFEDPIVCVLKQVNGS